MTAEGPTPDVVEHYHRLAPTYDEQWTYSAEYVRQFAEAVIHTLDLSPGDQIADVGCGTGLYAREIAAQLSPSRSILCVDPVQAMLDQLPVSAAFTPLLASAEDVAAGRLPASFARSLDAIVMKEAVHHVTDQARVIAGLADQLAPGGRLLVAMLPERVRYPLFPAALERYQEAQPAPDGIADDMRAAGLAVRVDRPSFDIVLDRERYLGMVRNRYMSVLSTFTDTELGQGVEEIARAHPEATLRFPDDFVFIVGQRGMPDVGA